MDSFWNHCLRHFEKSLPAQQYKTWIQPLHARLDQHMVVVSAPNRFVLEWVKDKFVPEIERLSSEFLHKPTQVVLTLSEAVAEEPARPAPEADAPAPKPKIREQSRLNPSFTFDSFVTGKANQLARAAALQVAEHPGVAYNPLFVYGGVGLGKTHLIQAIGNLLLELNPAAKVRYTHAEQYVSDVVRAYQHKAFDGFKKYYHSLDLLLIDDIQFFSGKNRTQEEFFYAFNALIEAHKQVIITCDTYPKEIAGIEDRLISRFGWGLTVAIEPPELEMRVAILLKKAEAERISLAEDIAFFIATHIQSNVRELEGGLKRVLAYAKFANAKLSVDLAREALKDLLAVQVRQVSVENIQRIVADYYKIKVSEMYSKKRSRTVARPRQVAMALAKELTHLSLPDIGDAFGGRDHTTVLHACRKIADLRASNAEITRDFDALLQTLRG
ncbi:MAG TPA: chromosomal replication initiator protein DnaA [Burkholderiales bacterium]|jgi:chromosomal replication initiator protein|nr:chromosomal replication initiator protein DnaA [Burkholderiales bacterium]